MEDRTYVKIFRKMLGWGWYGDTNTFRVFMHILLKANYQESEYRGHKIPAGACVFGRKKWSKELGLSEQQIRTAIFHLQSTNEITIKSTNKFTVVTLTNWEFWQIEEGKSTKKRTNHQPSSQPTSNQQVTTSKESKNIRNTTTPTIEDVRKYVADNNLSIDADYFYKYYETAEWKDVKGHPVKNWKLKALNWNRKEVERNGNNPGTGNRVRSRISETDGRGKRDTQVHRHKPLPLAADIFAPQRSEDDA